MTRVGERGPPVGDDGDRAGLVDFIFDVQGFLSEALNDHADWFLADLREPLSEAFDDLQPSFDMAVKYLVDPPDPHLLDAQLAHVGLKGRQLALKLRGTRGALDRFRDAGTKRAFRSVLGWANIILGTLAGLVPGGETIKEYKEAYEQASEDADQENASPRRPERDDEFGV
jgi:hypothetical protein